MAITAAVGHSEAMKRTLTLDYLAGVIVGAVVLGIGLGLVWLFNQPAEAAQSPSVQWTTVVGE